LASTTVVGADESTFVSTPLNPSLLVAGSNVIAVEVHQVDPTSSDISFDLELLGDASVTLTRGPYLQLGTPTSLVVRWRTSAPMIGQVQFGPSPGVVSGSAQEYQAAVFNMYPEMLRKTVLWPAYGNHDGSAADSATNTGPYYDIFTLPKQAEAGGVASGTEAYYSFDYANIHFVELESYETDRSPTGPMLTWLQRDLAANTQPWVIVFFHHPPYSKGSHDSDTEIELMEMRRNALPILENFGVDLVLCGHSHSYERSFLIDGHYGDSTTFSAAMEKNS